MSNYSAMSSTGACFITHNLFGDDNNPGTIRLLKIAPYSIPSGSTVHVSIMHYGHPILSTAVVGNSITEYGLNDGGRPSSGCIIQDTVPTVGVGTIRTWANLHVSYGVVDVSDLNITINPDNGLGIGIVGDAPAGTLAPHIPFTVFYAVE